MASNFDDPSLWRMRTSGGLAVKYLGIEGSFAPEKAQVTVKYLIRSSDVVSFMLEMFPNPIRIGEIEVPQSTPLPGLPGLIANNVTFKQFDDGKPADPFGFDPSAPAGTYYPVIQVSVDYGQPKASQDPKADDPKTFLEISGHATGDYLTTTVPKGKWVPKTKNPESLPETNVPNEGDIPFEELRLQKPGVEKKVAVKDPTIPIIIPVPQTEWTVKWSQIPFDYFQNVLIYRLRWGMGMVNSAAMPVLFAALPETILFAGYSYQQSYTWRDGKIGTPPVSVEMKFLEKRILWGGVLRTHNDFWRAGTGWETLTLDGTRKVFESRDLNGLFQIGS